MGPCALVRSGRTTTTATTAQALAQVTFSSQTASGVFRLSDSSIANATIDNANWGYWLECQFNLVWTWDSLPHAGLYDADLIYTITAAKG